MIGVYGIQCIQNGKWYIGQSMHIEKRWQQHILHLKKGCHGCRELQNDYNKYGGDKFKFTILEECKKSDELNLLSIEKEYIEQYDAYESGYNIPLGRNRSIVKSWKSCKEILKEATSSSAQTNNLNVVQKLLFRIEELEKQVSVLQKTTIK